jgi:hypothetical protein
MSTELVTPGHSPPLDTLIAMGIAVGTLQAHPAARIEVKKQGFSCRIESMRRSPRKCCSKLKG